MDSHGLQELSDKELEFYSRQIVLPGIGYDGQLRLREARVCIVGLGGLGCPASLQLAALGVGYLRLVDYDVVELSNLQRQHLYDVDSVGYPKVEVAARRLRALNPYVNIEPAPLYVHDNNAESIIEDVDVVVDGLDRMTPRYALNRGCVALGVPYVFGAAISTFGNVSTIVPGETACLECFQGGFDDESLPTCAVAGVHPSITNLIAAIQVSEATRMILGKRPRLANTLLHCDIDRVEFEEMALSRADDCPTCGSGPSPSLPIEHETSIIELCARHGRRTFVVVPQRDLQLDMDHVCSLLASTGLEIRVVAELGITFEREGGRTASLLRSGVMIVENAADEEEAHDAYADLVFDVLGILR